MNTTYPATAKQVDFIARLLGERDLTGTRYEGHTTVPALTKQQASEAITALLALPKAEQVKERANAEGQTYEAGVYEQPLTGRLFRVYLGQRSGTLLVKEIIVDEDGVGYLYHGSAQRVFSGMIVRRLSLAEVGAMGKTFDHCLMCGRRLDDPTSVDRGIGPVCAAKYDVAQPEDEGDYSTSADYTAAIQQAEREDDERAYASKPDADACTPGQQCDGNSQCTKHGWAYQNRYGRAFNE
jgi:hypothetical protein